MSNFKRIKISRQVMDYITSSHEFSDLNVMETFLNEFFIDNIEPYRLAKLKREMQKMTCQSYLLDETQHELLLGEKKNVISDVENKFQVKGYPYEVKLTADILVVFQVNPLTSISCVESSQPEMIQLDSLISIHVQRPDYYTVETVLSRDNNAEIVQFESWNISMNDHIGLLVPQIKSITSKYNILIEECLKIILKTSSVSTVIGISVPVEILDHLKEFSAKILTAVQNLPQNHKRPIYILLLFTNEKMKNTVIGILKSIADSKSDVDSSSRFPKDEEMSWDSANDDCTVDVIEGSITEQNVEVVVSSVHNFDLKQGAIASALLEKAGKELQEECNRLKEKGLTFPHIFAVHGYKSKFKYIFLSDIPVNDKRANIKIFVENCLKKTLDTNISSIAFPAVGTGNLGYKAEECAAQMEVAIANFKKSQTSKNCFLKIIIVIHPSTKGKEAFFELKKKFAEFKESKRADHAYEKKTNLKYTHSSLQWIQFFNYSSQRETLDQAIMYFKRYLNGTLPKISQNTSDWFNQNNEKSFKNFKSEKDKSVPQKKILLTLVEAKNIAFFHDLSSLVPDIKNQLDTMQNSLLVPTHSVKEFEKILTEFRTQYHTNVFLINFDIDKSHLDQCLKNIRQQYPKLKCEIINNYKNVLFCGRTFEDVEAAKYQLESFFGQRENTSFSPNRFQENNQGLSASAYQFQDVAMTESPYKKPEVKDVPMTGRFEEKHVGPLTLSSQNNPDVKCFQIESNFLIKIYEGNILHTDVDGIVNAANKWLRHGGGIAGAIYKAAGDIIDREGQSKLNGRTLNDGEVVSTSAGNLKQYKCIIHAVGPMKSYVTTDEYCRKKISETILNSLNEASQLGLCSIALPAISSGIFGVPLDVCADGYLTGVMEFCKTRSPVCQLREVHFVDMNSVTCTTIKDYFERKLKNY